MTPPPTNRQQAQDTIYRYYQQTLQKLPSGYALDNSRYGGSSASVAPCDDNDQTTTGPANYEDSRVVTAPPNTDYPALIAKVGDIWKSWGWRVTERDGFDKPNRFGYSPDGYTLDIKAGPAHVPGAPPTLGASSPCFPGDASRFQPLPEPRIITRDGAQLDEASASPTR